MHRPRPRAPCRDVRPAAARAAAIAARMRASPAATSATLHSVSSSIERLLRFALPITRHSSSAIASLLWTFTHASPGPVDVRIQQAVAAEAVRRHERRVQPRAQHAHRRFLQPAALHARRDDGHVRPVRVGEARGQCFAHDRRGEILVFDIQVPARRADRVLDERAHLPHRLAAVVARRRAGDAEPHVAHVDAGVGRPRIVVVRPLEVALRADRDRAAARLPPARPRLLADRGRRVAVEHRLHVVKRRVRRAVFVVATRVAGRVRRCVPARACQVEAADEREPVVDHDQLLVMGRAARMRAVEPEHDAAIALPAGAIHGGQSRSSARRSSRNPTRAHRCAGCAAGRPTRAGTPRACRGACRRGHGREPHPAVDVPADDEHRMACAQQRGAASKYASPSTSIVKRSAARIVSQLRPRSSRPCRGISLACVASTVAASARVVRSATVIGYRPPGRRRGASAAHRGAHAVPAARANAHRAMRVCRGRRRRA